MTRHHLALLAALTLPAIACGQNAARVQTARTSAYSADFSIVWNAALEAVKAEGYDRVKIADGTTGKIVTDWHKAERVADSQATSPTTRGGMDTSGAIFFRVFVTVEGKAPPYRLVVDGEAARYRPGYSSLFPFKHGDEGEPHWVAGRIDAVYTRVYDQLEKYAVTGTPPPSPAAPPTPEQPPEPQVAPPEDVPPAAEPVESSPPTEPAPAPGTP